MKSFQLQLNRCVQLSQLLRKEFARLFPGPGPSVSVFTDDVNKVDLRHQPSELIDNLMYNPSYGNDDESTDSVNQKIDKECLSFFDSDYFGIRIDLNAGLLLLRRLRSFKRGDISGKDIHGIVLDAVKLVREKSPMEVVQILRQYKCQQLTSKCM